MFWREVFNYWYNLSGTIFNVEIYEILFGVFNFNMDDGWNIFNFVLITAKWFIYQCKKENLNRFINNLLLYLQKVTIDIEKYIMNTNGKRGTLTRTEPYCMIMFNILAHLKINISQKQG